MSPHQYISNPDQSVFFEKRAIWIWKQVFLLLKLNPYYWDGCKVTWIILNQLQFPDHQGKSHRVNYNSRNVFPTFQQQKYYSIVVDLGSLMGQLEVLWSAKPSEVTKPLANKWHLHLRHFKLGEEGKHEASWIFLHSSKRKKKVWLLWVQKIPSPQIIHIPQILH